jgi:pseudouridine synthase
LTNDGDLVEKLTHPRYEHEKAYEVKVKGEKLKVEITIQKLKIGVDIGEEDGVVKAKEAEYLGDDRFRIILTEGKKRQIRRMFGVLGAEVDDLIRVRIGSLKLGNLEEGKWEYLAKDDIEKLTNLLI